MTTSGSIDFSMTRNEIIEDALSSIQVLGEDEAPSASMVAHANRALNRVVKHIENQSMHIWKRNEAVLFPAVNQAAYTLGTGSTDHATENYVQTTLSASAAASAIVLTVTSSTGMTAADHVGVILDSGVLYWTTIVSVDNATQITITAGLTTAASSAAIVFTYTTNLVKPLKIYNANTCVASSSYETVLDNISYSEYMQLSDKAASATSQTRFMFKRNNLTSKFFIYPVPSSITNIIKFTYAKPFDDFDNTGDTPDFPQEWYLFLVLFLAVTLAPHYGKAFGENYKNMLMQLASARQEVLQYDVESTQIHFAPMAR